LATEDLGAPRYAAWQITNECNLACLHCIEESEPGKAFRDEIGEAQVFAVLDQLMDPRAWDAYRNAWEE
jgi:MoaA/NifB/PqqE/SkfB family radical SAM enzyme